MADELERKFGALDRALHRMGPFGVAFVAVSALLAIVLWKSASDERWAQLWESWWRLLICWCGWALVAYIFAGRLRAYMKHSSTKSRPPSPPPAPPPA